MGTALVTLVACTQEFWSVCVPARAEPLTAALIRRGYDRQNFAFARKDVVGFYAICTVDYQKRLPNGNVAGKEVDRLKEEFHDFAFIKRDSRLLSLKSQGKQAVVDLEYIYTGSDRPDFKRADRQSVERERDLWVQDKGRRWLKRSERLSIR